MISDIDICQQAQALLGMEPMNSFDDGTAEANVAKNVYPPTRLQMLSLYRWRFATNTAVATRLAGEPDDLYDATYQLPADLLVLHTVRIGDLPVDYRRYSDKINLNASVNDTVILEYGYLAPEWSWPPYFQRAIVYELCVKFGSAITRRADLIREWTPYAAQALGEAKLADSQGQTNRKVKLAKFRARRS